MNSDSFQSPAGPIGEVREGMRVVDSAERNVGTVELVKMGDAEAATAQGQPGQRGLVDAIKEAFGAGEPQVPDQWAARLMRIGFVKVDGKGLLDRDLYVPADQVAAVIGDVVHLSVTGEDLMRES